MHTWGRWSAAVSGAVAAVVLLVPGAWAAAGPPAAPTTEARTYQAAVNIGPGDDPGGYAGAVSFLTELGVGTSVTVFLSKGVGECPDGSPETTATISSDQDATQPGPVTLDIDRRLRTAHGEAVVDLVLTKTDGCGAPEVVTALPAQLVTIDVTGTSVRFRTGIRGSVAAPGGSSAQSTVDLSRDGVGTASVGGLVDAGGAAFLRYAVERSRTQGLPPEVPANAAPSGGLGAEGRFVRTVGSPGEVGAVVDDVVVTATIDPPPARTETVRADVIRTTWVACPGGTVGAQAEFLFGQGPGAVTIPRTLAGATASATLSLEHVTVDGCTGAETSDVVTVPVSLTLVAAGPAVRVRDVRFQVTPGEGRETTRSVYTARDASGPGSTVAFGDLTGVPDLASISRAG